jgi:hypothetical protein
MYEREPLPGNDNYIEPQPAAKPEPWHPGDGEEPKSNSNPGPDCGERHIYSDLTWPEELGDPGYAGLDGGGEGSYSLPGDL